MSCPRQAEATMAVQLAHEQFWRADRTCSYCGSLSPEAFFAWLREHGPTVRGEGAIGLGMSPTQFNNTTKRLTAAGLVERTAHGVWRAVPGALGTLTTDGREG